MENGTRLKGELYGNPALQGGGRARQASRLEDGTRLKGGARELCRYRSHGVPARRASRPEVPSSRRDVLIRIPPA